MKNIFKNVVIICGILCLAYIYMTHHLSDSLLTSKINLYAKNSISLLQKLNVTNVQNHLLYAFSRTNTHEVVKSDRHTLSPLKQKISNIRLKDDSEYRLQKTENKDEILVPNIVYYNWFCSVTCNFSYLNYLSVLSTSKFINPDVINFHTNSEPVGKYFQLAKEIKNFRVVDRAPPDVKQVFYTTQSNVDRIQSLIETGGIYLDLDVLVIQSFDDLRQYPCVLGLESNKKICGGIIVGAKDSQFLKMWLESYTSDFRPGKWGYNSGKVPTRLAEEYPELIHIEKYSLHTPSWNELDLLYGPEIYRDWRNHYAMHTWNSTRHKSSKYRDVEITPDSVLSMNNTFAQIARHILLS